MSKGFVIFAQNNSTTDYVKQAELLKKSIEKNCQTKKVVILNDFDQDLAQDSEWKIENRYKAFELSPFDQTIVLDADMLCVSNIDNFFNCAEDISFTTKVKTYRNNLITNNYYRKTFQANNLPNVYSACYYFTKTDKSKQFFELFETICKNWQYFWDMYTPNKKQKWFSIDVAAAIACKILDVTNDNNFEFVHMKPAIQDWQYIPQKWTNKLSYTYDKNLYIGNFLQKGLFHYVEEEFTDVLPVL